MSLRFFWHKTLSMFCLQKWTIFGHLPARLKHLSWKTSWRPSARFRLVNINLNCPLFLVGGRFQNWTPGNSRGEELAWSSLGRRKEKANRGGEDPISRIKRNGEQDVPERRQSLHHGALVQRDQHRHSDHWSCLGTRLRLPAAFSVCLQVAEIREEKNRKSKNKQNATNFFKLPPGSATSSTAAALQLQRLRTPRTSTSTSSLTKAMRTIRRNKPWKMASWPPKDRC